MFLGWYYSPPSDSTIFLGYSTVIVRFFSVTAVVTAVIVLVFGL